MRSRKIRRASVVFTAVSAAVGAVTSAQTAPRAGQQPARVAGQPAGRPPSEAPPAERPVTNTGPAEASMIMQKTGGSLLRASLAVPANPNQARMKDVSFLAVPEPEPRTIKKHDLVTVIVREESAFSSKGKTELTRESDIQARLDEFIKLRFRNLELEGGGIGPTPPSVRFSSARETNNEGTVDRTDSLTARITGEVVDVKPNGTLVIQARKTIRTDEETQQFVLTGICRAEDINADNTVLSTQLYDLQLQKNHKGAVRDATKRSVLQGVLDAVNPF